MSGNPGAELFPAHSQARVGLSHTRPELLAGVLRRIGTGRRSTLYLGVSNQGATLDTLLHAVREPLHLGAHAR